VVAITTLKRFMSLSRKLCLFVHYVKQVDNKQWVATDVASIQWRGGVGCCMMNIRRRVQLQRKAGLLVLLNLLYNVYNGELAEIGSCYLILVVSMITPWQALCSC